MSRKCCVVLKLSAVLISELHLNASAQRLIPVSGADGRSVLLRQVTANIMEIPKEAADPAARSFSQVVFTDIPKSYPPATSITCGYTLTETLQPNPRDWVGVFKVGWSTTKDYHTFVWVEPCLDVVGQQSVTRQAIFKDYYLPKDEIEFYQFCYVDSSGQVRGASTPFCFRNPVETSLESSPDDDLLVITTQEQVDQSVREKAELQRELDQIMAEKETFKNALQQEQQDAAKLKEENEEKEKENSRLVRELDQVKEQNENLNSILQQQQKETEQLKEEIVTLKTKQTQEDERSQSQRLEDETKQKEKYDRAVMKINQLKAEREELRGTVESQSTEVKTLNSKLREQDRELLKMKDSVQLLQVDLQSAETEKGRLSVELLRLQTALRDMDDLKRANEELTMKISHLEAMSCPDDDLRMEYQALAEKFQDAQVKLVVEKEESKAAKRQAEFLDRELRDIKEQLMKAVCLREEAEQRTGKHELNLKEMNELIAERDTIIEEKEDMIRLERQEKEWLARENETLNRDIEGLRRLNADLQAASPADQTHSQPDPTPPPRTASATPERQQLEIPEQEEPQYESIGAGVSTLPGKLPWNNPRGTGAARAESPSLSVLHDDL
ncbi:calcium-binding and coiled-coil domain-containing protein 2 isoform X2 [Xyrichtys novacula]|uniref:Calcium-binding and coiled-coil domain-containing protein 2 isoform X2 n=1 Tax=Xyrichtys novacula TaxID=13765 RepID=A0AAV1H353_XYRNO|nr:calcium-binding and coiled-coil domain-containing protein 2 isoform X2 [Xyrichtys novacula]